MVKKSLEAKVRPLANPSLEKASLLGAGRIYVSKDSYISLTGNLENARHCIVERLDDQPIRREASLWVLPGGGNLSPNVVMMTRAFQDAAGFKVGDQIRVSLSGDAMPEADVVTVQEVGDADTEVKAPTKHLPCWEFSLSISLGMHPFPPNSNYDTDTHLDRAELVFPGMVFEGVSINKLRRSFKVISVNSKSSNVASFKLASTTVRILQENEEKPPTDDVISGGDLVLTGVPGLTKQVKTINQFLKAFTRPFWIKGERESCAMVLHGSSGTGKTFILQRLAATGWGRPFWIQPSDKLSSIRETFKQARDQQPSMIFSTKNAPIATPSLTASPMSSTLFRLWPWPTTPCPGSSSLQLA
jgi:AAA family ATPase